MFYYLALACLLPCILAEELLVLQGLEQSREIPNCLESTVLSCEKVLVNYDALLTAATLDLPLGLSMTVSKSVESGELTSMAFTLDNENEGAQGVFVYNEINDKKYVSGSLNWAKAGRHFKLELCSHEENCYTWSEINTDFWIGEGSPIQIANENRQDDEEYQKLLAQGEKDLTTPVTVTITIYTTTEFRASFESPDAMRSFIDLAITETNQGYANSKVPITMKLHCIVDSPIPDEPQSRSLLYAFLKASGGQSNFANFRKTADVAVILSTLAEDNCGIAFTDVLENGQTLGVVQKSCTTGYYSFAHEIAHMVGCLHNKENSPVNNYIPNAFAYLMRPPVQSGYRTILGYNAEGYETRVNYYSNPDIKYDNTPTGSPTDNNAYALTIRRFAMAAVGKETTSCNL